MTLKFALPLAAMIFIAACSPQTETQPAETIAETEVSAPAVDASTCPDEGPRLPLSGVCKGRAVNYMDYPASFDELDYYNQMTGQDCHWEVMEAQFATDVLLYQGVVCGENAASLEFAGGARASNLYLASSPFGPDMGDFDHPFAWVISSDPADPTANLQFWTREAMDDPENAAKCSVQSAPEHYGYPGDAYIVDIAEADRPPVEDGPYALCGPFGLDGDSASYWRVFADFSWFFQLGQEPVGIAPGSLTLITKDQ